MMSNLYDLYTLGCTCDTMVDTKGCNIKKLSKSFKINPNLDLRLKLTLIKLESQVIGSLEYYGESVPKLCTYRPSHPEN